MSSDPKPISAGAARSYEEATIAADGATCQQCGKAEVLQWEEDAPDASDTVLILSTYCDSCGSRWFRQYTAGPGWDDQPGDEEPQLARGTAPSTLLGEPIFREWVEQAVDLLDGMDEPGADASDEELEALRDERFAYAKDGLVGVLEIRKLRRAAGEELEPELEALRERFVREFEAAGGEIPDGI